MEPLQQTVSKFGHSARMARMARRWAFQACVLSAGMGAGPAQATEVADLLAMDLNRLLDVEVSVASRREQNAFELPAALVVLTADDIRRSGHLQLADVLRDVPGFHVGSLDGNKWAVSARNGLSRFSSTLLVLVDGRPVYTPMFGGVRWEAQNLLLADVQRIEIIRGPGGPLWGANAVDGIVNVVTRNAEATQGTLVQMGAGTGQWERHFAVRHGAQLGAQTHWRLSAQELQSGPGRHLPAEQSTHGGRRAAGSQAQDTGWSQALSARVDGRWGPEAEWSLQAQRSRSRYSEERALAGNRIQPNVMRYDGAFISGHWQQQLAGITWRLSGSLDELNTRDDILRDAQHILDVDSQFVWPRGDHTFTLGMGWRNYKSHTTQPFRPPNVNCVVCFGVWPARGGSTTTSLFVQDQWSLQPNWQLTLGAKWERYDNGRESLQPTLRSAWQPTPTQTLWAATTRAVRGTTRLERDRAFFNVPASLAPQLGCRRYADGTCWNGDPSLPDWTADVAEAGWRTRLNNGWDVDLALFNTRYTGGFGNPNQPLAERKTRIKGAELQLRGALTPTLSLKAGLSHQRGSARDAGAAMAAPVPQLPRWSGMTQLSWSPNASWALDAKLYHVTALDRLGLAPLPSHQRLDARVAWRAAPQWSWALSGSNLTGQRNAEYFESLKVGTAMARSVFLSLELQL